MTTTRVRILAGVVVLVAVGVGIWWWIASGRESTDDAQVDAHITPIAARVGGTVIKVPVEANQEVEAGTILVEIDKRDYEIALERARAELADAEAAALAAQAGVPITSTTASSNEVNARGGVEQADVSYLEAQQGVEVARTRLVTAQARQREAAANATKVGRDVERLKPLLAKDEIAQQQFDAAVATAAAGAAAVDSAEAQVQEAELGIRVAESRLAQANVGKQRASAELRTAQTAPSQIAASRARAAAADAKVRQNMAIVKQAELNLEYATVKAPVKGIVSRKSVEMGQVIQAGQPLMTVIPLDRVWVTANFKETQLEHMRPGQSVTIEVDAYGGREFSGRVESLAAATGSRFSLLPPDNATGNYVKVVQRVPVRILLDEGQDPEHLLRPGMSVVPTVYTR
ncbi:MAG TPA: HlyD family secretion protein [Vicinamibacterales bacterium]|nr:HlyD family secretion protein [Vicinamibacterales bacterium]